MTLHSLHIRLSWRALPLRRDNEKRAVWEYGVALWAAIFLSLVPASVSANIALATVDVTSIPQVSSLYMPVGARGLDLNTALRQGSVTGNITQLEFPGSYTECTSGRTFQGWYVAVGF